MADETLPVRRCATHDMSMADRSRMASMELGFMESTGMDVAEMSVEIPVAFIHVVDGERGQVSPLQRQDQIQVMNDAFEAAGIRFAYDESQVVVVDEPAFFEIGHGSLAERQLKTAHQVLDPKTGLNFYTAQPSGGILGWATFPVQREGDPAMDGVLMSHGTLPGGGQAPYNLGLTGVHEVGHWFGLYHTFQDGCFQLGDEIDDTPAHSGPNFGEPADEDQPHNLCPGQPAGSLTPIHNYMNYVDDSWMTEFTAGQIQRMWAQIAMFRSDLLAPMAEPQAALMMESAAAVSW